MEWLVRARLRASASQTSVLVEPEQNLAEEATTRPSPTSRGTAERHRMRDASACDLRPEHLAEDGASAQFGERRPGLRPKSSAGGGLATCLAPAGGGTLVDDFLAAITETLLRQESAQRRLAATRVIHTPRVSLDDALACHRCRKAQTADILKG